MIARLWSGVASPDTIDAYLDHLKRNTIPALSSIDGFTGFHVLRRNRADEVDVIVVTFWESLEAIVSFAGEDAEAAVVPQEAQALLLSFERRAAHYEVVPMP
jgi:heme-degrading monooxygenase HmoA